MNNSIYGKFLQNVRKYQNFVLVHRQLHFKREVVKSRFEYFTIVYEDLIGVSHTKVQLKLDKPIYCGMVILDLSKVVMYISFYDEIKPKYGDDVTVCATDTGSLLMDVHRDMLDCKHLDDLSNYDKNHFLYDETNKGKIGTF